MKLVRVGPTTWVDADDISFVEMQTPIGSKTLQIRLVLKSHQPVSVNKMMEREIWPEGWGTDIGAFIAYLEAAIKGVDAPGR